MLPVTMSPSTLWLSLLPLYLLLFSKGLTVATDQPQPKPQLRYLDAEQGEDISDCCLVNSSVPCKTLYYALQNCNNMTDSISNLELRVRPGWYYYSNDASEIIVKGANNFTLRGDPDKQGKIVFRCRIPFDNDSYNNLAIMGGSNVTIKGITVENCGPSPSGIYVESVHRIVITNCTFRNNLGGGIWIFNAHDVQVDHCTFMDNIGARPDRNANDSVFNFRTQSSGGLGLLYSQISNAKASVHNCTFINNSASVHPSNANDPRPQVYAPFGHGGGMVIRFSNYSNDTAIKISDCLFRDNQAYYSGGAIYVVMIRHPRNNSMVIHNSSFVNCSAINTGGGLSVQVFDVEENNIVSIVDSNFTSCSAGEGGGALSLILGDSLASTSRPSNSNPTLLNVSKTLFHNNSSPTGGSAVGLVSNTRIDQFTFIASFQDCQFIWNQANEQGAFLTFRFQVRFSGLTTFSRNKGGALLVFQTKVDTRGRLVFQENTAYMGGAVTLEDLSLFNLFKGTEIMFRGNRAELVGGAMLVNNPNLAHDVDPIFNAICFFQYDPGKSITSDEWNVTISFVNNSAVSAGAAIYAINISVCQYTSRMCEDEEKLITDYQRSIFSGPPFQFEGNKVMEKQIVPDIATEAAVLNITHNQELSSPGDLLSIALQARDQSGNFREAIWTIETQNTGQYNSSKSFSYFSLPASQSYIFNKTFEVENASLSVCTDWTQEPMPTGDREALKFFIIEELTGEVVNEENVFFNVTCCHPGYKYRSENKTCSFTSSYPHILRPSTDNRPVYLSPRHYAGFYKDQSLKETYFSIVLMPEPFQSCEQEDSNQLGCLYKYGSPYEQCIGGRKGFMCGACPDGQGVDLTLRSCKKCGPADIVSLVIICMLVVVGSILVLTFNIGVPNYLKGFLFFAQVVGFVYRYGAANDTLTWDFHLSHLLGFSLYLPICPFTNFSALWAAAFGLLPCIMATLTVLTYILCARVVKPLGQKNVFRGIWLIVLFVYKYIADTVANILKCVTLEGDEVQKRHSSKLVYFYDGNIPCFSGEHLGLAIPALLLLVFVVLLGPAYIILISFKRYKTTQAFTDVITNGVKLRMRWWGGFDLLRRLMFIVSVIIFDFFQPDYEQFSLCIVSVIVLGVLCLSKPYTDLCTNIIEAAILLDLLMIAFIFLNTKESGVVNPALFQILLLLSYLYAIIIITCKIGAFLWSKYSPMGTRETIKSLTHKLQSKLKPIKVKSHPKGLLVKSSSTDHSVVEDSHSLVPLGEEGSMEGVYDTSYSLYREELLDNLPE